MIFYCADGRGNSLRLADFSLIGDWDEVQSAGDEMCRGVYVIYYGRVHFQSLRVEAFRFMGLTAVANEALVDGCSIQRLKGAGIDLTGCFHVRVVANTIRYCGDDAIAVHTLSNQTDRRSARRCVIIVNNTIEQSFGIKALGGEDIVIGNTFCAIQSHMGFFLAMTDHKAMVPHKNNIVAHNVITDVLNKNLIYPEGGGDYGIMVAAEGTTPERVLINGNIISRTMPNGLFSSWGAGQLYSEKGWNDPYVTKHVGEGRGIVIQALNAADENAIVTAGNLIAGVGPHQIDRVVM